MNHPALPAHPGPADASIGERNVVEFACQAPDALAVCLVGDFNNWQPSAHPMQRQRNGLWSVRLELSPGFHQYIFLVDGRPSLIQTCGSDSLAGANADKPADRSLAMTGRR
jgi:1,4-alpha-glucan branching enzyme